MFRLVAHQPDMYPRIDCLIHPHRVAFRFLSEGHELHVYKIALSTMLYLEQQFLITNLKGATSMMKFHVHPIYIYIRISFSLMDNCFNMSDGSGNKHSRCWETAHPGMRIYKQGKIQDQNEEIHLLNADKMRFLDSRCNS